MLNSPLIQVLASLVLLILLGYFAYYVYLIEFEQMLKTQSTIKKEIKILDGIYDFKSGQNKYETNNEAESSYLDINPSINQEGGAEYSYNFWLYVDKKTLNTSYGTESNELRKDIILFLKGEKKLYYSESNKNCSNRLPTNTENYNIMIKNPLVRLSPDGEEIVVEYNNIYNPDSYQNRSNYLVKCNEIDASSWMDKNKNLIGIYNMKFDQRWCMITIVMKEISDTANILMKNRASCRMYINGLNVLNRKLETYYNGTSYSATFKNNKSPLYVNPNFGEFKTTFQNIYANNKITTKEVIQMADLKYYNYALTEQEIAQLYSNGFSKKEAAPPPANVDASYKMITTAEMEMSDIKEI
jgi:hypothetical protein